MNKQAAADLGVALFQKGGAAVVLPMVTLVRAYRDYAAGHATVVQLLSDENLSAIEKLLPVVVQIVQDPGEVSNIRSLVSSL